MTIYGPLFAWLGRLKESHCRRILLFGFCASLPLIVLPGIFSRPVTAEKYFPSLTDGQVIFTEHPEYPNQVYIIGISHRDTLTGANGPFTPKVDSEIYQIGKWLVKNRDVELLLPEGFFADNTAEPQPGGMQASCSGSRSMSEAEKGVILNNPSANPEMLLMANFPMLMKQIEDKSLYETVYRAIQQLSLCGGDLKKQFLIRSELDYHQRKRLGAMLQKIPEIIDEEFRHGHIHGKKALFTIGLSHISDIITSCREKKVAIPAPLFAAAKYEDFRDELKLSKEEFGITIILPTSLASDQGTLRRLGIPF